MKSVRSSSAKPFRWLCELNKYDKSALSFIEKKYFVSYKNLTILQ